MALISIENLQTHYFDKRGVVVPAVDDVSFELDEGQMLGLVGESGCGKTTTGLSVLRLISRAQGKIVGGRIVFRGEDILRYDEDRLRNLRGNDISMIFQNPQTSLNPVLCVGSQIEEAIRLHQNVGGREARATAAEMLSRVGITHAKECLRQFPHQLSGGMQQRVMIAMALCSRPELLIADEPTTSLDVTIQAQIMELIRRLRNEYGMAVMLITHNLGIVAEYCESVIVMYGGKVVERGPTIALFERPFHPYTRGLIASIPDINEDREALYEIKGNVPKLSLASRGCLFSGRCELSDRRCETEQPCLLEVEAEHWVACWRQARI